MHKTGALYVRIWERLSDALRRVMAATGASRADAQLAICQAMADRAIRIRAQLKTWRRHNTCMKSNALLESPAFEIPPVIRPTDLDWEASCPKDTWVVVPGAHSLDGPWSLAWIELRISDVTEVLCGVPQPSEPVPRHPANRLATDNEPAPDRAIGLEPTEPREPRRRGRRASKFNATIAAMRQNIAAGQLTLAELGGMLEKNLVESYGVSRDTARKARNVVLSEMADPNSRQIPTNDK
jgi:hypothetical protein